VGIAVVIFAVLYVTDNPFDVLFLGIAAIGLFVHFVHSSSPFCELDNIISPP
jgi:hypothetical protein